jgi:hypothetical protein
MRAAARTRLTAAAVAAALSLSLSLSLGVTACTSLATPAPHASTAQASAVSALYRLPRPRPGEPRKPLVGVNLFVDRNYSLARARAFGARDLRYIARTLGLTAVSIVWNENVASQDSDTVTGSPSRTPTLADLAALTSIARSYGLRVEYRVLFAVGGSDSRRGSIQPEDLSAWLTSLLAAETPALRLAERDHVSEFVAGTDMAAIDESPLWGGFFARAARLYHGTLSYAIWGGRPAAGGFFSSSRELPPIEYPGASAYPSITLPPTASVARLTQAWVAFLRQEPEWLLHLTAIDDLGIPAVDGAYQDPDRWNGLGRQGADTAIQANWFLAACQAAALVHVRALYFWDAVLSANPASAQPPLGGFEGHPAAEAAIRSCP